MLTCTAGALVEFQLGKSFFGKQIFSLFSAEKLPNAKERRILPKKTVPLSQPGDGFFFRI